jgi:hypothetical protein
VRGGPGGLAPEASVPRDDASGCPAVATAPDGSQLLASVVDGRLAVAERAAGGAFSAPVPLSDVNEGEAGSLSAGLSGRGDALVA